MRIGFVIYGSLDTLSGGYLYDRKLVEYLRSQGDTVEIISLPWRNYAAHLTDNLWFRLPLATVIARNGVTTLAPHVICLANHAGEQSPIQQRLDILIQDELNHPSLIFANRGRHPYPVISLVHHLRCSELRPKWQNTLYSVIETKYLQSVDGFIFNSKTTEGVVNGLVENRKPSTVAYPPTDRFGKPVSEEEIIERAKSKEFRILFLGNVIFRKGLHTVLEAVKRLKSSLKVEIVGGLSSEPGYVRQIQKFVSDQGLSSFVYFRGSLDREPLIEKLKQAHALVVPSSYEGYGIVYLEGMCFGLPAIGTTSGAASEIISHRVDGFLIEPGNAAELARRLMAWSEDRELLIRMGLAARERYLRQPKWEETAGQIREFLQSFLGTIG